MFTWNETKRRFVFQQGNELGPHEAGRKKRLKHPRYIFPGICRISSGVVFFLCLREIEPGLIFSLSKEIKFTTKSKRNRTHFTSQPTFSFTILGSKSRAISIRSGQRDRLQHEKVLSSSLNSLARTTLRAIPQRWQTTNVPLGWISTTSCFKFLNTLIIVKSKDELWRDTCAA